VDDPGKASWEEERAAMDEFDFDAIFGADYLYFFSERLSGERSDSAFCHFRRPAIDAGFIPLPAKCQRVVRGWFFRVFQFPLLSCLAQDGAP
jgi:hypothetical protein